MYPLNGFEVKQGDDESREDSFKIVKNTTKELDIDFSDCVIDRAHRIGKVIDKGGKRHCQIIVRFTTCRHPIVVYKARKISKS